MCCMPPLVNWALCTKADWAGFAKEPCQAARPGVPMSSPCSGQELLPADAPSSPCSAPVAPGAGDTHKSLASKKPHRTIHTTGLVIRNYLNWRMWFPHPSFNFEGKLFFATFQKRPQPCVNSNKLCNHAKWQCTVSFKVQDWYVVVIVRELYWSGSWCGWHY